MTHLQRLEQAVGFQRLINAITDKVAIEVDCSQSSSYFVLRKTDGSRNYKFPTLNTKEEVLGMVQELLEPKWTQPKKVCVDLIGETIWFNKEQEFTVKSILSKDTILGTDGLEYNLNECWIKE